MREIRSRDELILTVNRLMICAMEDIDCGRNEASPTTLDLVQRIEDTDAALRLALDEATRERDEARICNTIVRERVESILANWMRPPGGQQAGVPDKSISPQTCREILRSLGPEQGSYTYEEWQRLTAERDEARRIAAEHRCVEINPANCPTCSALSRVWDNPEDAVYDPAPPADAAREAVRYWTFQTEWGDGYRPAAVLFQTERIASLVREQNVRLELNVGPVIAVDVPLAALSSPSPAPAPSAPAKEKP